MHKISFFALLILIVSINIKVSTAHANNLENIVTDWINPGTFPFQGEYSDVCELYPELTSEQCARALDQRDRALGIPIFLQDGEILQVSFTVGGEHRQKTLRVAFGADITEDSPMRKAWVYDTGRHDGVVLVYPEICGNWSLMTVSFELDTPSGVRVEKKSSWGFECRNVPTHRHDGGRIFFVPGIAVGGVCNEPHFIPGVMNQELGMEVFGSSSKCFNNFDNSFN